jgi:LacI family transcriptional regulator
MKRMDITIDDIAIELGISVSTVSRALNNHPRISDATKQKVLKKAKELGYKPGMSDYGKRLTSSGQIVALVCPHLNNRMYRTALEKLQPALLAKGIIVSAFFTENRSEVEKQIVTKLIEIKPAVVVLSTAVDTNDYSHFNQLIDAGIPLICFNRVNFDYPVPKIIADNYQGAFSAASKLIAGGANRIGVIVGNRRCHIYEEIVKGIKQAVYKVGRAWRPEYVVNCNLDHSSVEYAIEYLFSLPEPPDAMIVGRPQNALHLVHRLKERNISVPNDIPVVAFGAFEYNMYISPSISTIEADSNLMADELLAKVEEILLSDGEQVTASTVIIPTELFVRGTSFR